jgi:aspartyl-tRNA(Asn)/glutamyl-tRNA(Gln) amidotransferase subunit B
VVQLPLKEIIELNWTERYELVIGLEVHAQLLTETKLFSSDSAVFGNEPNHNISTITLAHPGTLPKLNKKAVTLAVRLGLACNCEIERENTFARKHYFYPDLPKAYQTSQHTSPVCKGGHVTIQTPSGKKNIPLNRIHLEEDAGKSIHDMDENNSFIDYNRAGTPLVEIVTEPAIHSADEAYQFLTELRRLVRWIEVCDGNMEEGSFRCDANLSLRKKGATELGTKVEVKNLNSIRNVKKAIEVETERIAAILNKGEAVQQQTRSFDASNDTTFSLRDKEEANDYRYFPDPDLPVFMLDEKIIKTVADELPMLPGALMNLLETKYGLNEYDSIQVSADKLTSDYFIHACNSTNNYKAVANWLTGPVKEYLNTNNTEIDEFSLVPDRLAALINFIDTGKINFSAAASKLFPALINDNNTPVETLANELQLLLSDDTNEIEAWINTAIKSMPDKVEAYRKGKKGLIGLFVGEVKKLSKGKADPKMVTAILEEKLKG